MNRDIKILGGPRWVINTVLRALTIISTILTLLMSTHDCPWTSK